MAMNVLISNDDGYNAFGINVLSDIIKDMGHRVYVVAPDRNQSATSHSLTLTNPLRINKTGKRKWMISGTPTDCVLIATHGLLNEKIHMVLSGINHGPNMGEDIFYSGTVAAAMEGHLMGIPSIAFSLAAFSNHDFSSAEHLIPSIINYVIKTRIKKILLNVNIPSKPFNEIKGIKITELGSRVYSDTLIKKTDPRGRSYYWIGGQEPTYKKKKGTDFQAIEHDYVSITPMHINLTDSKTASKLKGLNNVF